MLFNQKKKKYYTLDEFKKDLKTLNQELTDNNRILARETDILDHPEEGFDLFTLSEQKTANGSVIQVKNLLTHQVIFNGFAEPAKFYVKNNDLGHTLVPKQWLNEQKANMQALIDQFTEKYKWQSRAFLYCMRYSQCYWCLRNNKAYILDRNDLVNLQWDKCLTNTGIEIDNWILHQIAKDKLRVIIDRIDTHEGLRFAFTITQEFKDEAKQFFEAMREEDWPSNTHPDNRELLAAIQNNKLNFVSYVDENWNVLDSQYPSKYTIPFFQIEDNKLALSDEYITFRAWYGALMELYTQGRLTKELKLEGLATSYKKCVTPRKKNIQKIGW